MPYLDRSFGWFMLVHVVDRGADDGGLTWLKHFGRLDRIGRGVYLLDLAHPRLSVYGRTTERQKIKTIVWRAIAITWLLNDVKALVLAEPSREPPGSAIDRAFMMLDTAIRGRFTGVGISAELASRLDPDFLTLLEMALSAVWSVIGQWRPNSLVVTKLM